MQGISKEPSLMRGSKAKALRRAVYGDASLKAGRIYRKGWGGERLNVGLRAEYLKRKKFG